MNNFTVAEDITEFSKEFSNSRSSKSGLPKYKTNVSLKTNVNVTATSGNSLIIVALIEGRGNDRGQIGMASMDLRHSELSLCQFVDTSSYTLLKICLGLCEPVEIILPEVSMEKSNVGTGQVLIDLIRNNCNGTAITPVQRRFFNDTRGIELVKQLGIQECSNIDTSVFSKYSCMAAAAALIKYVEYIQNLLFAQNSLKITYEAVEDSCLVDVSSWKNLDLIHLGQKHVKGEYNSLFDILNSCVTTGGMRTLRSCLLQPCTDPEIINSRLDVVEELMKNDSMRERLRSILSNLRDFQQLITMCVHINLNENNTREESKRTIRNKIAQAIQLKNLLTAVRSMRGILQQAKSPFFEENQKRLADDRLTTIADLVNAKLDSGAIEKKRKGAVIGKDAVLFAISEGQHVLLDLARRAYNELLLQIMEAGNSEQKNLPAAHIAYTYSRGYHLNMSVSDPYSIRLPPHCIQVVKNKASLSFTTRNLIKYNDRLVQSENEILLKSNLVLDQLIMSIRELLPVLYNCVECISLIDFFAAMACYSSKVETVRPIFGETLLIRHGRHPILDYKGDIVPNDTYLVRDTRFAIIAGPNMAGKSTYMRQVCLLQILAQCGCRVPAEFASFIPMKRIFSRVGHNDDLCQNMSGFAVEMSEMAVILSNANEHSLIIIDELARSTSTEEGIGMCYALCEELIASNAFVLFATHFLDLSLMELNFPAVVNFHFSADTKIDEDGEEFLVPSHVLYKGSYKGPLYGLELAELTTLPKSILIKAREMANRLRANVEEQRSSSQVVEVIKRKKLSYLAHRIIHVISLKDDPSKIDSIASYLKQLQTRVENDELL